MANAFSATSTTNSTEVLIFSKLYLILFVFIFIYIVLSLFIGIFDHAYDSLSVSWSFIYALQKYLHTYLYVAIIRVEMIKVFMYDPYMYIAIVLCMITYKIICLKFKNVVKFYVHISPVSSCRVTY